MLFDRFCGIAERHFSQLEPLVRQARLFVFPGKAQDILPDELTAERRNNLDLFTLPFETTAVEDEATLTVLQDAEPDQIGLDKKRHFIDVTSIESDESVFDPRNNPVDMQGEPFDKFRQELREKYRGGIFITTGTIESMHSVDSRNVQGFGSIGFIAFASKKQGVIFSEYAPRLDQADEFWANMRESACKNAMVALSELHFFSTPNHFILEEEPAGKKKGSKKDKIPRSDQRPIYTVLSPKRIRQKLGLNEPEQERKSPVPHERRRHLRRLSTEGGYFKQDRVVPVKASWVGPSEARVGNKIYRVRLDLF